MKKLACFFLLLFTIAQAAPYTMDFSKMSNSNTALFSVLSDEEEPNDFKSITCKKGILSDFYIISFFQNDVTHLSVSFGSLASGGELSTHYLDVKIPPPDAC